jgi:hypothetical protein
MASVRSRFFIVFLSIAVLIISASVIKAQETDVSLILSLSFEDGKGKVATDISKYGNNGALKGDPKWVDGKFGKALQLNGSTDWVEVPHADILTVDKEITVMAWIKADRYEVPGAGYQGIVSKSNDPRSYSLYTMAAGTLHFSTAGVGTVSVAKVPLKEWVHVAAVVVDGKHRYYFNGKLDSESGSGVKLPGLSDKASVLVGKTPEGSREFGGIIDEVRIWNKALTIDEIVKQMDKGGKTAPVESNGRLVSTWAQIKNILLQ